MPGGCDETCEYGNSSIQKLFKDSSYELNQFIIYYEFEPDIFFPSDEDTGEFAFRLAQDAKCDFGGGNFSVTTNANGNDWPTIQTYTTATYD